MLGGYQREEYRAFRVWAESLDGAQVQSYPHLARGEHRLFGSVWTHANLLFQGLRLASWILTHAGAHLSGA